MNKMFINQYSCVFLLTLALLFVNINAGFLDDIKNTACASFVAATSTGLCYDEFTKNYEGFNVQDNRIPEHVACCGVSIMQSCLEDQVAENCGDSARSVAKSMTTTFLKTTNQLSGEQLTCDWEAWYYDRKSPVCWPVWGQAIGGIAFLIILLGLCGCCCCRLCCRKSRGGTTYYPVAKPRA